MQSVHNPYDVPPPELIDVNETYAALESYPMRIYAGMVSALDMALNTTVRGYMDSGLWENTVLVFTSDNGGIEYGNNYPLRGCKVQTWEGGIRAVAFVRGTDSPLARVRAGSVVADALMHSTDWLCEPPAPPVIFTPARKPSKPAEPRSQADPLPSGWR